MDKTTSELFSAFLDRTESVWNHAYFGRVFTICLALDILNNCNEESFIKDFNHWNETHGISLSMVKIKNNVFIVYENNNNGVQITDLTGENRYRLKES